MKTYEELYVITYILVFKEVVGATTKAYDIVLR